MISCHAQTVCVYNTPYLIGLLTEDIYSTYKANNNNNTLHRNPDYDLDSMNDTFPSAITTCGTSHIKRKLSLLPGDKHNTTLHH